MGNFFNAGGGRSHLLTLHLWLILLHPSVLAWSPEMPGGMKLVIDGETHSFSTDVCSGGIFFKKPVHVQLTCYHGFFLRRKSGCDMGGSDIIGGRDFVCDPVNNSPSKRVQAFIPLTNPERPLERTFTFFDGDSYLGNFRRYTYSKGLEGIYAPPKQLSNASGLIVTNEERTPPFAIENWCYEGRRRNPGSSAFYKLNMHRETSGGKGSLFVFSCPDNAHGAVPETPQAEFAYRRGFSSEEMFQDEIEARVSMTLQASADGAALESYEIWGGLAYCLQLDTEMTSSGHLRMIGLRPAISSLTKFCATKPKDPSEGGLLNKFRKQRGLRRSKRDMTENKLKDLTGCIANCFGQGAVNCERSTIGKEHVGTKSICPPYCQGTSWRRRRSQENVTGIFLIDQELNELEPQRLGMSWKKRALILLNKLIQKNTPRELTVRAEKDLYSLLLSNIPWRWAAGAEKLILELIEVMPTAAQAAVSKILGKMIQEITRPAFIPLDGDVLRGAVRGAVRRPFRMGPPAVRNLPRPNPAPFPRENKQDLINRAVRHQMIPMRSPRELVWQGGRPWRSARGERDRFTSRTVSFPRQRAGQFWQRRTFNDPNARTSSPGGWLSFPDEFTPRRARSFKKMGSKSVGNPKGEFPEGKGRHGSRGDQHEGRRLGDLHEKRAKIRVKEEELDKDGDASNDEEDDDTTSTLTKSHGNVYLQVAMQA